MSFVISSQFGTKCLRRPAIGVFVGEGMKGKDIAVGNNGLVIQHWPG